MIYKGVYKLKVSAVRCGSYIYFNTAQVNKEMRLNLYKHCQSIQYNTFYTLF